MIPRTYNLWRKYSSVKPQWFCTLKLNEIKARSVRVFVAATYWVLNVKIVLRRSALIDEFRFALSPLHAPVYYKQSSTCGYSPSNRRVPLLPPCLTTVPQFINCNNCVPVATRDKGTALSNLQLLPITYTPQCASYQLHCSPSWHVQCNSL